MVNQKINEQANTIENMAVAFAKTNKVSKAKTLLFVESVIQALPKQASVNRAAETRNAIRAMRSNHRGTFTSVELAKRLETDVVAVNNSIRHLMQTEKIITQVGKAERSGKRGKRPLLWSFVN